MRKNFLQLTLEGGAPGCGPASLGLVVTAMICGLSWLLGLPCARCLSPGSAAQLGLNIGSCVGVASLRAAAVPCLVGRAGPGQ